LVEEKIWTDLAEFSKDFSLGTKEGRERFKEEWPELYKLLISEEPNEEEIKKMERAIDSIVEMGFPYFISKEDIENNWNK